MNPSRERKRKVYKIDMSQDYTLTRTHVEVIDITLDRTDSKETLGALWFPRQRGNISRLSNKIC